MSQKFIWVLVIILVAAGAFVAGNYSHDYLLYAQDYSALSKLPTLTPDASQFPSSVPGTPVAQTQPALPASAQPSTGPVKVVASTPTSITVQTGYKTTKTYTITPNTKVYSVATAGQLAKSLSDITAGTFMNITPLPSKPTEVSSMSFVREASLQPSMEDTLNSLNGTVTKLSDTAVTITPADSTIAPVTIALDPSTNIITQVTPGQKGRALAAGSTVLASGLTSTGGKITAKLILLPYVAAK